MPNFEQYHIVPASEWVLYPDAVADKMRTLGGFPVNDKFVPLWERPDTKRIEKVMAFGGYGGGKTVDRIQEHILLCDTDKYFKCFYGREVFEDAKKEFHSSIVSEIQALGLEDRFEFSLKPNGTKEITHKYNGNVFKPFGCDDSKSMGKGWNNATHILIDEINEISFKSYGMLLTRLRSKKGRRCITGIFNTMDVEEEHWLCSSLYLNDAIIPDDEEVLAKINRLGIIKHYSNFTDNYFIDQDEYRESLSMMAGNDDERRECILNAGWGSKSTTSPFYKQFRRSAHVGIAEYNPYLALHISFDENVNPYLPFGLFQIVDKRLYMIGEIAAKNPNNTLRWVCGEICRLYGKGGLDHQAGMIIYGDATSRKDDVKMEKGKDVFVLCREYLEQFSPRLRVNRSNPNVAIRQNFINDIFGMGIYGLNVTISPRCTHTITDLINTAEAPDGNGKDKTKLTVDGVRGVQRYGHFSDLLDYIICEAFSREYAMFKSGGKKSHWAIPRRTSHTRI